MPEVNELGAAYGARRAFHTVILCFAAVLWPRISPFRIGYQTMSQMPSIVCVHCWASLVHTAEKMMDTARLQGMCSQDFMTKHACVHGAAWHCVLLLSYLARIGVLFVCIQAAMLYK